MKQKLLYICLVIAAFAWSGKAAGQVHLPINKGDITKDNYTQYKDPNSDTGDGSLLWDDGIGLGTGSGWLPGNTNDKYFIMKFDGIPDKLSFSYKTGTGLASSIKWYVAESTDGKTFNKKIWEASNSNGTKSELDLSKDTRYIKFCYSGRYWGIFSNIEITELQYLTADKESLDFGVNPRNSTTTPQEIKISHCNAGLNSGINVTSSDSEHFEVSSINFDENGNPGRDVMGTGTFTVRYLPKEKGVHTGTITISDGVNPDVTVQVKGETTVDPVEPEFTWTMSNVVYTNRSYSGFFSTNNGDCDYTITCTPEDMARIDRQTDEAGRPDYHITFLDKTGEVTFTVMQEGNDDGWIEHSETYTVTVEEAQNHVPFTIDSQVKYNTFVIGQDSNNRGAYADNAIRLGGNNNVVDNLQYGKYAIIEFSGIPDKLSFTTSVGGAAPTGIGFYVQEAEVNGLWGTNIWETSDRNNTVSDLQLKPTTRFLKIGYTGNYWAFIQDLTVTERFDFYVDKHSLDFEEMYDDETRSLSIVLSHCNAGNGVKVVSSDSHFTVTPEILTSTGGDCMGEEVIMVTYHNDELITDNHSVTHTGTITITDDTPLGSNPQPFEPIVIEVKGTIVPTTLWLNSKEPSYEVRTYKHVVLNRELKAGYNTIALPFATSVAELIGERRMTDKDWVAQLHTVTKSEADGYSLYFQKVDDGKIVANQPYVLHLEQSVENPKWENINKEITTPDSVIIAAQTGYNGYGGWTMTSNFDPGFPMDGKYGVVNDKSGLQQGGEGSTLNAFTAYITPPATEEGNSFRVRAAYIDPDGTTTFVDGLPTDEEWDRIGDGEPTAIYGSDGTQRARLVPGVNIVRYGDGRTRKVYKN